MGVKGFPHIVHAPVFPVQVNLDRPPGLGQQLCVRVLFNQAVLHTVLDPGKHAVVSGVPQQKGRIGGSFAVIKQREIKASVFCVNQEAFLRHIQGEIPGKAQPDAVPEQHGAFAALVNQFAIHFDSVILHFAVHGIFKGKVVFNNIFAFGQDTGFTVPQQIGFHLQVDPVQGKGLALKVFPGVHGGGKSGCAGCFITAGGLCDGVEGCALDKTVAPEPQETGGKDQHSRKNQRRPEQGPAAGDGRYGYRLYGCFSYSVIYSNQRFCLLLRFCQDFRFLGRKLIQP